MGLEPWLAAAIVGLLTLGIGYMLATKGLEGLRRTSLAPTQTIETLKEDAAWTTNQRA